MCRIGGIYHTGCQLTRESIWEPLQRIARAQQHGGPDGEGFWLHPTQPLGLCHRRLAILDLSEAGAQPMTRHGLVITYNGEVYNFRELRQLLEKAGEHFTTQTDTEVLLLGWRHWGLEVLQRARGMWAFALWDGEALWLVRDRFGVKPLFYTYTAETLVFASELTALVSALSASPTTSPDRLHFYLSYGFLRSPYTFYEHIWQIPPGCYLRFQGGRYEIRRYWEPERLFFGPPAPPPSLSEVEETLLQSFKRRLVADVPVGLFLSGGLDSSLVAALLAKRAHTYLPAFTLGFSDSAYNEAPYAEKIARYLGLPHYVFYISDHDLLSFVEKLPTLYGQPFGNASALAVYALAGFARERVKVVLSADGGDELFGGYVRHRHSRQLLQWANRLTKIVPLGLLSRLLPEHNALGKLLKLRYLKGSHYGELIQPFPELLASSLITIPFHPIPYADGLAAENWDSLPMRQLLDLRIYLPDDGLQKVDRATMAHALEAREPFLDPELVALSARLPTSAKVRGRQTKHILRVLLRQYLPPALWQRPKQGFAPPLPKWLNGPLKERLNALLYSSQSPLWDLPLHRKRLVAYHRAFLHGHSEWAIFLWHVLVLGLWAEQRLQRA
ncbi:MAG: asparagine synthase (glutamine-hydrolyzing) [Bacteroidia bacterium]